jgi:hypothetical protein
LKLIAVLRWMSLPIIGIFQEAFLVQASYKNKEKTSAFLLHFVLNL